MSGIANLDYGEIQDILSGLSPHPKRKRGRPNKKPLIKDTTEPKKREPPVGSKNKKNQTLLTDSTEPKKRGRPEGIPDKYPRKCPKNTAAAVVIQKNFRAWASNK
jgi:hypothetical protein